MAVFVYLAPPLTALGCTCLRRPRRRGVVGVDRGADPRQPPRSATKTLFYQLAVSTLVLPVCSLLLGETGVTAVTPLVLASLAYQGIIVAFGSYLVWFSLLTRYLAARLSVLSFLTPLFGMASGVVFLSEPLSAHFAAAALLIATGIALVNFRR